MTKIFCLQCNRLLFDGGVLWSSKPAEPPCMLKWTGPLGGYRRFMWLCSSVDSGESKLNDFMRKFNFWRRGECGAVFKRLVCCCVFFCVSKRIHVVCFQLENFNIYKIFEHAPSKYFYNLWRTNFSFKNIVDILHNCFHRLKDDEEERTHKTEGRIQKKWIRNSASLKRDGYNHIQKNNCADMTLSTFFSILHVHLSTERKKENEKVLYLNFEVR